MSLTIISIATVFAVQLYSSILSHWTLIMSKYFDTIDSMTFNPGQTLVKITDSFNIINKIGKNCNPRQPFLPEISLRLIGRAHFLI